jgi:hypothetical protein
MEQWTRSMLDPRLNEHLTDQEFATLLTWCENARCAIRLVQWLGGGNTQAQLAAVLINDGYPQRKAVLKYCPSRSGVPRDFLAFNEASKSGPPGFAKEHLVGMDPATDKPIPNGSDGLFLLMEWRGGGRDNYDTMRVIQRPA